MVLLLARDGAKFSGTIQRIGSQFRVSYLVSLDLGPRMEMQRDIGAFPSEDLAISWLQRQAAALGFEHFSLEWRSPLGSDTSPPVNLQDGGQSARSQISSPV
jgi:hypothetical protein